MASFNHNGYTLTTKVSEYTTNSTPAILAIDEFDQLYGVLTVNLDDPAIITMNMDEDDPYLYQYLDVNDWPGVENDLEDCSWCQPTGWSKRSGFVQYPIYKWLKEEIDNG